MPELTLEIYQEAERMASTDVTLRGLLRLLDARNLELERAQWDVEQAQRGLRVVQERYAQQEGLIAAYVLERQGRLPA